MSCTAPDATAMPPPDERTEVVIIGGGPAGLTLANLLGLYGVRTILLEQNPRTVGEPRAVSIDDESFRTLQVLGLAETAMRDCAQGYGSVYLAPNRRPFAAVHPSEQAFGWPKRNAFRQPNLEATLADGASARPGVAMRFSTKVLAHQDQGDEVWVRVADAAGERTIGCTYLVGCDGGRSQTRRAIGATLGGSSFEERWLILDTLNTSDPFRETRVFCDPYRPALSLPGPNRARRYEIRLRPGEEAAEMETEAKARELIAWYGGNPNDEIERRVVYTFQARVSDKWRRGRVFLAGDAAHLTPPFAGQGMNAGLRDVSNLAWKLAAVLHGRLGEGLLDSYETERRDHAWSMITLAVTMGRVMSPHSAIAARFTRLVLRIASAVPAWKDWLVQMRYKPKPRFTAGFQLAGSALAGTMFIQPLLELAPGDVRRLDDVVGDDMAWLIYAPDPALLWARMAPLLPPALTGRIVGILPETCSFAPHDFSPLARDLTGAIGRALAGEVPGGGCAVLLRPDRYVAAVIDQGQIESGCAALQGLVAATHGATSPGATAPRQPAGRAKVSA